MKEALSDLSEALECATGERGGEKCQQMQHHFQEKRKTKRLKLKTITEPPGEGATGSSDDPNQPMKKIRDSNELSMFDHVETVQPSRHVEQPPAPKTLADASQEINPNELLKMINNPQREYPQTYHSLEFLPFNPVPEQLDAILFPHKESPLPLYDDPYWPTKQDCLKLLGEIRGKPNYVAFTGTFITPEARGAE